MTSFRTERLLRGDVASTPQVEIAEKPGAPLTFFLPNLRGGGAERVMLNLASSFADIGHNVHLVLVSADGDYLSQVPDNVKVVHLGARQTLFSLPALVSYLRRENPRVMLTALEHTNVVAIWAKRLAGVSTIIAAGVHTNLSTSYQSSSSLKRRIESVVVRLYYPLADHIIAVSKGVADDLSALMGLSRDRIDVIYNPVVSDELLKKSRLAVDHPWFAPGEPPVIISAGRLIPLKNHAMLLRAFAKVREQVQARLMILGEGEERSALEELARDLKIQDAVSLPGFAQNPYAYMNKAAVFALSSNHEGLPTVLIEALACGVRVVSTDCPSGPREILNDGEYGRLVPVDNADAMAEALLSTLDDGFTVREESWMPYCRQVIVDKYSRVLGLEPECSA